MGQRSRKRRAAGADGRPSTGSPARANGAPKQAPEGDDGMRRGYARGRQRDEAARASLQPLGPGERPLAVTISAAAAAVIAVANIGLYLAGWQVQGEDPNLIASLAFCGVLLAAAAGMWRMRYWAVLGFEVLLGVLIVFAALSLLVASNIQGALLAIVLIALAGPLFWSLIRVMARLQMPTRRPDAPER